MFAKWMPRAVAAISSLFLLVLAGSGDVSAGPMNEYGPLTGYIQFSTPGGTLQPNGIINATPACHVARRLLCTTTDASCGTGGVRRICSSGEKRVQIGATVYCDKWVCS